MVLPSHEIVQRISQSDLIAVDIETTDPLLKTHGPGTHNGTGSICGVAIANNNESAYIPIGHPDVTPHDREIAERMIRHITNLPCDKVGANIAYDAEWLQHTGYGLKGTLHDIQYAEPLIYEYAHSYSLDALAKKYTNNVKQKDVLKRYCDMMGWKGEPIKHIAKMPTYVAAEYANMDAVLPLEIFAKQKIEMERMGLMDVYNMEVGLMPFLLQMRRNGVRVDVDRMERTAMMVAEKRHDAMSRIEKAAGYEINPNSAAQLGKWFDRMGWQYERNAPTPKMLEKGKPGSPKFDAFALEKMSKYVPVCKDILDYRHNNTLISLFFSKYLDMIVGDRLYCTFHPLRSDDYGTVAGRYSSSKPNLQQVPSDKEDPEDDDVDTLKGQIVRDLFIPEDGCSWCKLDYSQVEYRITAHYAVGPKSDYLRQSYIQNPDMDYHKVIQDLTGFKRKVCKTLNFGQAYGMGVATTANNYGWDMHEAKMFIEGFHSAAPYLKATRKRVNATAARRGYIYTIMGRWARLHETRSKHSFFNRLIQGSAADIMKKGMLEAYNKGLFEVLIPHVTVHDEVDVSKPETPEGNEALAELKNTMEQATKLDVPLIVDVSEGPTWAENKE